MNKKRNIVISFLILLGFLIIGSIIFILLNEDDIVEKEIYTLYKINFYDDYKYGYNYEIYIDNVYNLKVVSKDKNGYSSKSAEYIEIDDYVKNKFKIYFDEIFSDIDSNSIEVVSSRLSKDELNIFYGIIYDDEDRLYFVDDIINYDYKLDYYGMEDYSIYKINNNVRVVANEINFCDNDSGFDCVSYYYSYDLDFSYNGMNIVRDFIDEMFLDYSKNELDLAEIELNSYHNNIINGIITNDESYLNYLFTIKDVSCNCIPNVTYFYDDGNYITRGINYSVVEKNNYESDVDYFIENLTDDMSDEEYGLNYLLEFKDGKKYYISHDNEFIKEFLDSLDITWH